jgi:sulfonate transport system ATP-binding protein
MTTVLNSSAPETSPDATAEASTRTPARTGSASALPVSFRALRRTFGSGPDARTVLRDVDFEVRAGEVLAILGTSGCGKSTLLRATAGLDSPTSGSVDIDGTAVQGIDSRCAFAFQEPRLLPWHTLRANVAIGLPAGVSAKAGKAKVARLLELVGLKDFAKHRPREVSGGMAQRASLARALARNPGVLLLDEPFGALDALTRIKMQDLLLDIHRAEPTTVLLVTHDVDEALQLADRIIVLGKQAAGTGRADSTSTATSTGTGTAAEAGAAAAAPGATIVRTVVVPGERPRERASAELARMRSSLLESLGVDAH